MIKKRDFTGYGKTVESLFCMYSYVYLLHLFDLLDQFQIGSGHFQVGFECLTVRRGDLHRDDGSLCQYPLAGSSGNKLWKFWVVRSKCTPETGEFHHI